VSCNRFLGNELHNVVLRGPKRYNEKKTIVTCLGVN
jgi:hypothetical protein